jgi:transposase
MAQRSGLTRGDRRRNARIEVVRTVVRPDRAVLAIDLGEDRQVAALMDHDCRVLGRRVVKAKAHQLGGLLRWAGELASRKGFAGVVVGCEPTGHRWRAVMALADEAGVGFVCVQPLRVHLEREADDYTRDKTDHKDAVLIGRLVVRLGCYLPERADADWARLRHLGARRARLVGEATAYRHQMADLLGCCWPAALSAAAKPWESKTWLACLCVVADAVEAGQDLTEIAARGVHEFTAAARVYLPRFGGSRLYHRIVRGVFAAVADPGGVAAQRLGGLERTGLLLADWHNVHTRLCDVGARMTGMLDAWGLTALVTSIPGLSAVGAAMILAETGDLSRFATARSVVKHAGLNPAENTSATLRGTTRVSRRGRPGLRAAAWKAVWAALPNNPILARRFTHLTTRPGRRLAPAAARSACAATLLRWLHAIVTRGEKFDPRIAAGHTRTKTALAAAA